MMTLVRKHGLPQEGLGGESQVGRGTANLGQCCWGVPVPRGMAQSTQSCLGSAGRVMVKLLPASFPFFACHLMGLNGNTVQ